MARRYQQGGYYRRARGGASVGASGGATGGEEFIQQFQELSLDQQNEHVGDTAPNIHVLNSVECRRRYLQFIGNAAAKANRHHGKVTLYIASAPNLDVGPFVEVLRAIGDTNIYRSVFFFLRQQDFLYSTLKASAEVSKFFRENMACTRNVTVFLSKKPKYFHTKWAAYTMEHMKTKKRETEILLTTANIIKYHMNKGELGDSKIFNSLVLYQSDKSPALALNQMLGICKLQVNEIKNLNFAPTRAVKEPERVTVQCVIPNPSSKEIYMRIQQFMQDKIGNRPSRAGHTIYIVSPFIATVKKTDDDEQTVCSNVIRSFIKQFTTMSSQCSQNKPVLNIVYNWVNKRFTPKEIQDEIQKLIQMKHKSDENFFFIEARNKFHCKFIAYVALHSNLVRILHTSANFNDQNMTINPKDKYSNLDWLTDEITITRTQWDKIKRDIGF